MRIIVQHSGSPLPGRSSKSPFFGHREYGVLPTGPATTSGSRDEQKDTDIVEKWG
jgi:hypothetical protein